MPIIAGTRLAALEAKMRSLLDEDTLRRRGGHPIPPDLLTAEPCNDLMNGMGHHRLHIAREPMPETTAGGIHVPTQVREANPLTVGWIIAAAEWANNGSPEVLLGAKVMFGKYSGGTILVERMEDLALGPFLSIREGDLWAFLPDDLGLTD